MEKKSRKKVIDSKKDAKRESLQPTIGIAITCAAIFVGFLFYIQADNVTNTFLPFDAEFPVYDILGNQSWSSVLSGHYFGLKSARPYSPIFSMMWFRNNFANGLNIRDWCSRDDNLNKYYWTYNDLHFGEQIIQDGGLLFNLSFIKSANVLRSKISAQDSSTDYRSLVFYSAVEHPDDSVFILNSNDATSFSMKVSGKTSGDYVVNIKTGKAILSSYLNANSTLDKLNEVIRRNLYLHRATNGIELAVVANAKREVSNYKSTFVAYQIVFQKSLQVEIELLFDESDDSFDYNLELIRRKAQFEHEFKERFSLPQNASQVEFARTTLSNTIGGISYFYGHSQVQSTSGPPRPYGPVQLLTAVPSRAFFPRGFLWDEGFHQLLISRWNPSLSMKIIRSWLELMNKEGWIPREVILGDEAIARVPSDFLTQRNTNANPPTLFMAIESLIDRNQADRQWLYYIYPRLKKWYDWFNTTQHGSFVNTFRWRGRNATTNLELNPKTLTSGLDDFPRATHPTEDEIHLDLLCWMALASRVMSKISSVLGNEDHRKFEDYYQLLKDNQRLEELHWSSEHEMFCDKGLNSEKVKLKKIIVNEHKVIFERQVLVPPKYGLVPHFGYVSLFPLMMKLLEPDNPKLLITLNQLTKPDLLWTPNGLRSLSKSDTYYRRYNTEHDPPYWRGAIWININYLVLKSLEYYSHTSGPYQERAGQIYVQLQNNLVDNIYSQFVKTGYLWEQYSDSSGKGTGQYPFNGWTALIVEIMSGK